MRAVLAALAVCLASGCSADVPARRAPGGGGAATERPARPSTAAPADTAYASAGPTDPRLPAACPPGAVVESAQWVDRTDGVALRVVPGERLRRCGGPLRPVPDPPPGWDDLVERVPDAGRPGMREQYGCHLHFAPGKAVWHLEPWREVVDRAGMVASLCNPGPPDPDLLP